jgi:hypothetical protein
MSELSLFQAASPSWEFPMPERGGTYWYQCRMHAIGTADCASAAFEYSNATNGSVVDPPSNLDLTYIDQARCSLMLSGRTAGYRDCDDQRASSPTETLPAAAQSLPDCNPGPTPTLPGPERTRNARRRCRCRFLRRPLGSVSCSS